MFTVVLTHSIHEDKVPAICYDETMRKPAIYPTFQQAQKLKEALSENFPDATYKVAELKLETF